MTKEGRSPTVCAWHGHWIGGESPSRGEMVATASQRQLHAVQSAEFRERQLLIVDVDGDFAIRVGIVDDTAELVEPRDALALLHCEFSPFAFSPALALG